MHRFIGQFDLSQSEIAITDKKLIHQIKDVLKLKVGENIVLGNGVGGEAEGEIASLSGKEIVIGKLQSRAVVKNLQPVVLYCSVLKKENFEWVVQKATEVGVDKIVPIICAHTVKTNLNIARLQKIAHEAAEQSGRVSVPEIDEPVAFKVALQAAKMNDGNFFCERGGKNFIGRKVDGSVGIFIGPEGGWEKSEVEAARANGCEIISLGKNVLRAETAAVVASYLVVNTLSF